MPRYSKKKSGSSKTNFIVGDLNINSFDYDNNALVKYFFNLIFQSGFLPLIQRVTRVKRATATVIDHIITDAILESITKENKLFKNDIRNTWKTMKQIIDKNKCNNETLPKHLIVDKIEIHDAKSIAEKFNDFFVIIVPNLANKIPQCNLTFKSYLPTVKKTLKESVKQK